MGISDSVGAFFPASKQLEMLENMLEMNQFDELHDVLGQIEFETEVIARIEELATSKVLGSLESFLESENSSIKVHDFVPLLATLDQTFAEVQKWVAQALVDAPTGTLEILALLEATFTERSGQNTLHDPLLYRTLVALLANDERKISNASSQVLRWQATEVGRLSLEDANFDTFVWTKIPQLLDVNGSPAKFKNGLLLVLRILCAPSSYSPGQLTVLRSGAFWKALKAGLAHESHEIRKYSLSILRLVLQNFPKEESISNELMIWDSSSSYYADTLASWAKFITLYEIVALDTALNQLEAASGDILDILESTFINSQWGLVLFSTGLKAAMESVRRHTVKLMFKVKDKSIFHSSTHELAAYYLPVCMFAPYFMVEDDQCPYGEALSTFVRDLVVHTKESQHAHKVPDMISSILNCLYENRTAFDPPRIYICLGLYQALKSLKLQVLNEDNIATISKLFEVSSEEGIFECTIQTLYLKMMMNIKLDTSPKVWIQALARHVRANKGSYQYISPILDDFVDVSLKCFGKVQIEDSCSQLTRDDQTLQVLAYAIFGAKPEVVDIDFLKELGKLNVGLDEFKTDYANEFQKLVDSKANDADYQDSHELVELQVFSQSTWNIVNLETLYSDVQKNFNADKFGFFTACYIQTVKYSMNLVPLDLQSLTDLYEILQVHTKETMMGTFKYKDYIHGDYFSLLLSFLKTHALQISSHSNEDELDKVLALLTRNVNDDNGNYEGNLRIAELCEYLLDTYVLPKMQDFEGKDSNDLVVIKQIVDTLCTIWDFMAKDRLVLNQRKLHLKFIETLFHPTIVFFAVSRNTGYELGTILFRYGSEVIAQAVSRRTFLPTLGRRVNQFMETFGKQLQSNKHDYYWLIDLTFKAFVQSQDSVNAFKLKPIVADMYDKQVDSLRGRFGKLYEKVYQIPEISYRVYLISSVLNSSDEFLQDLFIRAIETDDNLLRPAKSTNGAEELERLLKWQLLMLSIKSVDPKILRWHVSKDILRSVATETSPLVRVYSEWIVAFDIAQTCFDKDTNETEAALFEMLEDQSKPLLAVTATRILFVTLKSVLGKKDCDRLLNKFISKVIPNCASNKPLVRHFSNSLMLTLWPLVKGFVADKTLASVIQNLCCNAERLQVHGQFRLGDAVIWDLENDLNLTSIFGGVLMKLNDHSVPYINENTFSRYLTSRDRFPVGRDESDLWLNKRPGLKQSTAALSQKGSPLQTKSGAWEAVMNLAEKKSGGAVKRTPLVVVASLVDKAPNLGGICRLCDVLGAGLLTVHDIRVKDNSQFKSVAVTADRWMPMEAVAVDEISQFMRAKKKEGYTLIGLEQTDKSLQLDNKFSFPAKSLILLGTEAEGIPGHLLGELDLCLEIKQSGVIRSMNIQTATAVIVHSYSAQHT
ncbi:LAFA_0G08812g1_1 [Lachancea sp. 'fantastica']|nr:LAFA_0G08812g1_1 [Lachancea sp. 'fantastica']